MRKLIVKLCLYLVAKFGTTKGVTYTVTPGRLDRSHKNTKNEIREKMISAWYSNKALQDANNPDKKQILN